MHPPAKKSKAAILVGGSMLLLLANPSHAETPRTLAALTDPALTEAMMKKSGFRVPFANGSGLIFLPWHSEVFQVIGRFTVPREAVEGRNPIAGKELIKDTGTCQTYRHKRNKFEPAMKCTYTVTLSDYFIHKTAFGQMSASEFFVKVNANSLIPAIGGREITDPVEPFTFNLNKEINSTLLTYQSKVWQACWNPRLDNTRTTPFDNPNLSRKDERKACGDAKMEARQQHRNMQIEIATVENEEATRENERATERMKRARKEKKNSEKIKNFLGRYLNN